MATNVFFGPGTRSEHNLYEDLVIEALGIYGQDVVYIPREEISRDEILNEEYSRFEKSYVIEMYIANVQGFEGQGNLLSKFGLEIREQATFVVSRRRFENLVDIDVNKFRVDRPREGDLIYLPLSKSLFEVMYVEHEKPFYQINNLPVYQLTCELFEYSDEKFDTGISEVDRFESINASQLVLDIEGGTIGFKEGEVVEQTLPSGVVITGEVALFERVDGSELDRLYIVGTQASDGSLTQWAVDEEIVSVDNPTNDSWTVKKLYGIGDDERFGVAQDPIAQNEQFEIDGDDIISFTESNPFGEPRD